MNITPEICEAAIGNYVTPIVEAGIANGNFGRRDGALVIATTVLDPEAFNDPNDAFHEATVIYEHSWGKSAIDGADFSVKALQKVFGTWKLRLDYDRVLTEHPEFVTEHGLITYPGAVIRDVSPMLTQEPALPSLIAAYAGLWWWHDTLLASTTLNGIRAELTKRHHDKDI